MKQRMLRELFQNWLVQESNQSVKLKRIDDA